VPLWPMGLEGVPFSCLPVSPVNFESFLPFQTRVFFFVFCFEDVAILLGRKFPF